MPHAKAERETFCTSWKLFAALSGIIIDGEEKQELENF